ncbi:hypothetical protein [Methylomagnum ishizawai]|uniref:hypothetical protein n=1 Tax=Methylomagnum ishizawai TaxID=1760988 RepID=UPI001C33B171|nr:hypothetical protein [Methylomagnum ishizawai]BBL73998.1 hypothetical protein MishRS11D_10960 [Methylomagnum ishizawai]
MDIDPIRWGWLAGIALMVAGCGETETLDVDHVLSVSDTDMQASGKPIVIVKLGGDDTDHLDITLRREDIRAGFESATHGKNPGYAHADAFRSGVHFLDNAQLGSTHFIAIESLDPSTRKAVLQVAVYLCDFDGARCAAMDARRFEISGSDFDHLTQSPKR